MPFSSLGSRLLAQELRVERVSRTDTIADGNHGSGMGCDDERANQDSVCVGNAGNALLHMSGSTVSEARDTAEPISTHPVSLGWAPGESCACQHKITGGKDFYQGTLQRSRIGSVFGSEPRLGPEPCKGSRCRW